ncbi:MAG: site-2 protease family protein, partial [Chloroflexi bacterium]|nr:site-2 protease family protein [Chloroflexota bacterium]
MFGLPLWLLIFPVLGLLIFVHELGHFLTAKYFGIKVTEFGFGFPPRIFGIRYGDTTYTVNLIPLGGFVRMVGEEDPTEERSFASQAVWKRVIVLVAGSFMNILTPLVIFTILFVIPQDTAVGNVVISGVAPGSPAQEAGIRAGDTVISFNGERVKNHYELIEKVMASLNSPTEITLRRGSIVSGLGQSLDASVIETVTIKPRLNPPDFLVVEEVADPDTEISLRDARRYDGQLELGDTLTQGAVGVIIGTSNVRIVKESFPIWEAVPMAFDRMWNVLVITKNGFQRWIAGGPDPGLTGPIGIARVTGLVAEAGIAPIFELIALISISLGVMNILPIPALDGGRLMFVLIEWARHGKRISPER